MKTVTIAAPLCAPDRQAITGTVRRQLVPYHFNLGPISAEKVQDGDTPLYWQIKVPFTDQAAEWGEYVLLRYGYQRSGAYLNPENAAWAARHLGAQPQGPWYAPGCKDRPRRAAIGEIGTANPPRPWDETRKARRIGQHAAQHSRLRRMLRRIF